MLSENELIQFRRELHSYPETGWCEFVTTAKIVSKLRSFGIEPLFGKDVVNPNFVRGRDPQKVEEALKEALRRGVDSSLLDAMGGFTGAVAVFKTGRPGPTVGIRVDIDCVDVEECRSTGHRPFDEGWSSTNPGHMHSCGHDGHTAIGIGVCSWISENIDKLCGTIKVFFQPAEEGVRGAVAMAESGLLDDVDYMFGGHVGMNFPTGTISPDPGTMLATTKMDASFTGVPTHAGVDPEKGKNALLAAATAAIAIHAIPRPVNGSSSLNVGTLHAGQGRNVVAPNGYMQLETRGETEAINAFMREEAIRRINAAALMYDCQCEVQKTGEATEFFPDREAIELVYKAAEGVAPTELIGPLRLKVTEDFSIMLKKVQSHGGKGTFTIFGCKTSAGHHNGKFDFDENVIGIALRLYQNLISLINGIR